MDAILIGGLRVTAQIGVHDWEQALRLPLLIDLELTVDLQIAGRSDRLEDTVDYAAVAAVAETLATAQSYRLIEAYAQSLARALLERFPIQRALITVSKPGAVAAARTIAVRCERRREDYPELSRPSS